MSQSNVKVVLFFSVIDKSSRFPRYKHVYIDDYNGKFGPKAARQLLADNGAHSGEVTRISANPQNGEKWHIRYKVTRKSCRKVFEGYR